VRAEDASLVAEATRFALEQHAGQTRKGRPEVPYASHLLRVAGLVMEHGGDARQIAVALLHDVIEDCGVEEAELERRFGGEVARAVRALSDTFEGDTPEQKAPWRERKTRFVAQLGGIDARARLVAACDKLDNLSAIVADLETEGLPATATATYATARYKANETPSVTMMASGMFRRGSRISSPRVAIRP
jgi:(p)ppGpp synthase/HD superfamily hydrolase